jgi:hypothetical protein
MYTEHLSSRWCTPDFHSASTTISAFDPPWQQDLWPSVQVIRVNCLQPGGDSLLHVSDCCKPLASQVHIKVSKDMETTRYHTCAWLLCYSWRLRDRTPYRLDLAPSDFSLFGPPKKQPTSKGFATDADMKQAVTSWLKTIHTIFFYTKIYSFGATVGPVLTCRQWLDRGSGVYHLRPMYHVYNEPEYISWRHCVYCLMF